MFTIRAPELPDRVILWGQYHALKALAIRLDAGIGTERDYQMFEAGLREYNQNFNRVRTCLRQGGSWLTTRKRVEPCPDFFLMLEFAAGGGE